MADQLLNSEDLKAWSGIKQDASLRRWLDQSPHQIPYKVSPKGEICTTLASVTEALSRREGESTAWVA